MIDFFHRVTKTASMTKRISGIAKLVKMKGAPKLNVRPPRSITHIGTFFDGEDSKDAAASILLEVVDTPETRRHGMMGRSSLEPICGMLFKGLSGNGFFWMKDCLIPLDVAFMDEDGAIEKICSMPVDKEGERHYDYGGNVRMAVETPMGFFKNHGISKGFRLKVRKLEGKEDSNG